MISDVNFRQALVEAAATVMHCAYCCAHAEGDQPQPGWIGSKYKPDYGVAVVLQNPGAAPKNYGTEREASVQQLLRKFSSNPTIETHEQLMSFMLADMAGKNDGRPWARWTHPVSKLIRNRERMAWMNIVKFRTPASNAERKDAPVARGDVEHGAKHVQRELEILRPKAVITIGSKARDALDTLHLPPSVVMKRHLRFLASTNEAERLQCELLDAKVDIG